MDFTRRNVGAEASAPEGDEHERMASSSLINASSIAGQEPHVVESSGLGIAPFVAEQECSQRGNFKLGECNFICETRSWKLGDCSITTDKATFFIASYNNNSFYCYR